jgi:hypothetical protein
MWISNSAGPDCALRQLQLQAGLPRPLQPERQVLPLPLQHAHEPPEQLIDAQHPACVASNLPGTYAIRPTARRATASHVLTLRIFLTSSSWPQGSPPSLPPSTKIAWPQQATRVRNRIREVRDS